MKPVRLACFLLTLVSIALAQTNPVPLINNPLVPDAAAPGGASFTLTVNGTGFVSSSVVKWNGSALATNFVSSSQLTATVPAANIAAAGTASITAANPGVAASNVEFFNVRKSFPAVSYGESTFSTDQVPVGLVTADLNNDAKLDIATINGQEGAGSVSILIGNGDGTFQAPEQYSTGFFPSGLVAADFNGDGNLDLAFVNYPNDQGGVASVLLGNGDGTFQSAQNSVLPDGSIFVGTAAGDFNGDGKLDLAVAQSSPSGEVLVLLGNGDGTFQSPVAYTAGTSGAFAVATGDFNADGVLDLVVSATNASEVFVLLGNGNGTFQGGIEYSAGNGSGFDYLTIADFNGDGKLDLAVDTGLDFSILLGNGDGTLQAPVSYSEGNRDFNSITAEDLNGDGRLDIVAGEQILPLLSTSLGNGDGTFQNRQSFPSEASGEICCVLSGDFNSDGLVDLAQSYANGVEVLLQATSVLSTTRVNFGTVKAGSSTTRKATLSNIGAALLTINKIKLAGDDFRDFSQTNDCGSSLPAGASCTLTLQFNPRSKAHFKEDLTISDSAVNDLQIVTMQGVGD